jgi:hypothetical protein
MNDVITLPRSLIESGLFVNPEHLGVYVKLVSLADENGEIHCGLRTLANDIGTTYKTIRTVLNKMAGAHQGAHQGAHFGTLITLYGKDDYKLIKKPQGRTEGRTEGRTTTDKTSSKTLSKSAAFVPPTLEQVRQHIADKQLNVDAEKFFAYYESNGWMVGKNKMKKWQMALVTWNRNQFNTPTKSYHETEQASRYARRRGVDAATRSADDYRDTF